MIPEGNNTFAVSCGVPCAVAVSYDGGATYTRLAATADITLAHSFSQRYEKGYDAVIHALAGVVDREMRQIISPSWHDANFLQ